MKLIFLFGLCALALHIVDADLGKCFDKNEGCHSTNYESYVECVRRRQKRSIDCDSSCESGNCINTCSDCDCESCNYSTCNTACNSCCSSCCSNYIACRTNHCCHKTCHAQCKSTSCRSSCRKSCFDTVDKIPEVINDTEIYRNSSSRFNNDIRHNITTIIHLNNVINNTNVIDIPITLNNTNQQNITLYNENTNYERGNGQNSTKCCIIISPRQCVPHNEFPYIRCFHYRSRQCGQFCTASIVHKEQKTVCQSTYPGATPNCQQQIIYIPQPQPRCTYQSSWPYVSCGIQRSTSCGGCYSHYVDQSSRNYLNCPSQCYDDGFGIGPYYRQGPFFRPGYTHVPCVQCLGYNAFEPYGGFSGYSGGFSGGYGGYSGFGGYGGYEGIYGGYPALGYGNTGSGFAFGGQDMSGAMPFGSWSPGEVNSFETVPVNGSLFTSFNNSNSFIDPLVFVGPGIPSPYINTFRPSREVEIELNYDKPLANKAEVKIKNNKNADNTDKVKSKFFRTLTTRSNDNAKTTNRASTVTTVSSKLS